jgi:hypothetical protein
VDARLVRAYLQALPDAPPDARSVERVRACLASLQSPDVRYLVASVSGPGARAVADVAASVLRSAGARTGILARTLAASRIDGGPLDDALLANAGTVTASAFYTLAASDPKLGEPVRRDAEVTLLFAALAASSHRVVLVVGEDVDALDPSRAPIVDLAVICGGDERTFDGALALVPDGRPVVAGSLEADVRRHAEKVLDDRGVPALLGGRDHRVDARDGTMTFVVRDEPYVSFPAPPGFDADHVATGIATALALGVMGIRMREDWVTAGIAALAEPAAA